MSPKKQRGSAGWLTMAEPRRPLSVRRTMDHSFPTTPLTRSPPPHRRDDCRHQLIVVCNGRGQSTCVRSSLGTRWGMSLARVVRC